jgi:uncharacterized membrane protein YgdD (TMEM256/DUF423 family)
MEDTPNIIDSPDKKNHPSRIGLGWVSLGAGLAGSSVLLGAFGAHSLKAVLTEKKLATFHTATDYLGYHALGLIGIGILMLVLDVEIRTKLKRSARWISAGILLFPGSLYALTFDGPRFFGPITPLGGLCFMIGWFTLAFSLFKYSKTQ